MSATELHYAYGMAGAGLLTTSTWLLTWRSRRGLRRRLASLALRLGNSSEDASGRKMEVVLGRLEIAVEQTRLELHETAQRSARLSGALDMLASPVIVRDDSGRVDFANVAADAVAAGADSGPLGPSLARLIEDASRSGSPTEQRLELYGPPRRSYRLRALPIDDGRRSVGVAGVAEDMSAEQDGERRQRHLVAEAGHVLRRPLGALSVLADMLQRETTLSIAKKLAARIDEEALVATGLLDDLLGLEELDRQREPDREATDMAELTRQAALAVMDRAAAGQVRLQLGVPDGEALVVVGDARQLRGALVKLLESALAVSPAGSTVVVAAEAFRHRVRLAVADAGRGLPEHELERLFSRFHRRSDLPAGDEASSGLGLAQARLVAELHGGSLEAESSDSGTVVTLWLPISRQHRSRPAQSAEMEAAPLR